MTAKYLSYICGIIKLTCYYSLYNTYTNAKKQDVAVKMHEKPDYKFITNLTSYWYYWVVKKIWSKLRLRRI